MRNLAYDAVDLATRNWRIVPLHTPRGTASGATCDCNRPGCPSVGKHPRVTDWVRQASADLPTVGGWWEQWPAANIGVATGPESGIVVLDIDPRHGGDEEFLRLLREHDNDLPLGPACATGGGGEHYYFKHPGGRVLSRTVAPGIDVKGDGGQVVAPPSVHATGMSYEWYEGRGPDIPCPDLPDWLLMLMQGAPDVPHEGAPVIPSDVPQGERNNTLASFGGSMRSRGASQNTIFAALLAMNDEWSNPLSRNEVATIAASVSRYEPTTAPLIIDIQTKQPQKRGRPEPRAPYVPQTYTARELGRRAFDPQRWAVDPVLPEGLCVLAGKPKIRKSWFALSLAVAIAEGGIALGAYPVEDGDALVLALEDGDRRLFSRLRAMAGEPDGWPDRLHMETRWPREDEGGLLALEAWLGLHPNTRLIVVDTLAKFRPRGVDAKYADDYAAIEGLQQMALRNGVCVLLITHFRKATSDDWLDNVTGTLGIAGAADTILGLERPRGASGDEAVLRVTGRDVEERDLALRWDMIACAWRVMGEAQEYRMSKEMVEGVAIVVRDGGVRTAAQWAPILEKKRQAAWMFLRRAVQQGLLHEYGGGLYGPLPSTASTAAPVDGQLITLPNRYATPVDGKTNENEANAQVAVDAVDVGRVDAEGGRQPSTATTRVQETGAETQGERNDGTRTDGLVGGGVTGGRAGGDRGGDVVQPVRGDPAQGPVPDGERPSVSRGSAPFAVSADNLTTPCPGCGEVAWTRRVGNRWMCGTCDPSHVAVGEGPPWE